MGNNTQQNIDRVCAYRRLPRVKKGTACIVDGKAGEIIGGNSAANFNVRFNDDGRIRNCHPYWKFQILDDKGVIYFDSDWMDAQRYNTD